jgi:hypothetical protein
LGDTDRKPEGRSGNLALRIGLAGALGVGALVTGFILTRSGRKLMGDVLAGRKRTPLEGRVLDALWSDRVLGRRHLDVSESEPGHIILSGTVTNWEEMGRANAIAEGAKGVKEVENKLEVGPESGGAHRASVHPASARPSRSLLFLPAAPPPLSVARHRVPRRLAQLSIRGARRSRGH